MEADERGGEFAVGSTVMHPLAQFCGLSEMTRFNTLGQTKLHIGPETFAEVFREWIAITSDVEESSSGRLEAAPLIYSELCRLCSNRKLSRAEADTLYQLLKKSIGLRLRFSMRQEDKDLILIEPIATFKQVSPHLEYVVTSGFIYLEEIKNVVRLRDIVLVDVHGLTVDSVHCLGCLILSWDEINDCWRPKQFIKYTRLGDKSWICHTTPDLETRIFLSDERSLLLSLWQHGCIATWELMDTQLFRRHRVTHICLEHICTPVQLRLAVVIKSSLAPPAWDQPIFPTNSPIQTPFNSTRGEETLSVSLMSEAAAFLFMRKKTSIWITQKILSTRKEMATLCLRCLSCGTDPRGENAPRDLVPYAKAYQCNVCCVGPCYLEDVVV